ncbi:MAG: tetratricopeptide repeat protein [Balneolaceae bacterium]
MKRVNKVVEISAIALLFLAGCEESADLPPVPENVQAFSLLGDKLYVPEPDPETESTYNQNLQAALDEYQDNPDDPDALIWLGRRTAYLGEYREAVEIFTDGIRKHPDDPRMYRHRGHRYITLRMFEEAILDFETAAVIMRDMEDQAEPDGLPNELNQPTSTLKSNVWYHLGLAQYLQEDYDGAVEAYENTLDLDLTDDMRIATIYWYYMALRRAGLDDPAGDVIEDISPDIELIENDAYLNLILVFNGVFSADRLMESSGDALTNSTLGYGIGNWHYMNGREDRAFEIWQQVYDSGNWPAFGFIASEVEIMRRSD